MAADRNQRSRALCQHRRRSERARHDQRVPLAVSGRPPENLRSLDHHPDPFLDVEVLDALSEVAAASGGALHQDALRLGPDQSKDQPREPRSRAEVEEGPAQVLDRAGIAQSVLEVIVDCPRSEEAAIARD
ncbi:MAG: hypothetical protein U0V73_02335 [Acidimicrobiia bacterium]